MCNCLYCYKPLGAGQKDFHPACSKKIFGTREAPDIAYSRKDLDSLAEKVIKAQTSLTGVQPKLSLNLDKHQDTSRLTIVGLWGDYILKPQTEDYEALPEVEDLTMHLAEVCRISVVPHSLIRLADGSLAYITRRIDRTEGGEKIDMEDMCQLTLHPTEYKYKSSYEQVAKTISKYSSTPKLCVTNFFQVLLFCFITGNNDMHLKNFSLYAPDGFYRLSLAYDLLNTAIVNPKDKEEMALTLNGKKSNFKLLDFLVAAEKMGIDERTFHLMLEKFHKSLPKVISTIDNSFLTDSFKQEYKDLIYSRLQRLK